jgi:RHS repeat-associated protein
VSNQSGGISQVISLPKGGGALSGIGEKFSPDLHTGTGNFSVPIALPPGRNGFQPQLSLTYSTGTGNGPFGLGWSLSVPGITRKTSKGIPRYRDGSADPKDHDVFVLSGAEDLVPVSGPTDTPAIFRPRTEGLFARIQRYRTDQAYYWKVESKDGLVSYYGTAERSDPDQAIVADPANRGKIFAWKLSRTEDPFGNRIEYEYLRDSGKEGPHCWDQLYLSEIRYADYGNPDAPDFLVKVRFVYEPEPRPDPFSDHRAGFEIRTRLRCARIDILTNAGVERLTRSYHFVYRDQRDGPASGLPLNGASLLDQLKVVGLDGDETEQLPPLEFGYTSFEPRKRQFIPLTGRELPAGSLGNPDLELVDLFGNGLPDILEMNGTVRYWRNLGGGVFDTPRAMTDAPAGLALADAGVQLVDANGDGRADLLLSKENIHGYFPLRFGALWDRKSFQPYAQAPSFDLEDPEVRLVDLDGDGVTDAIRSGTSLECFFNDSREGWNRARRVPRGALEAFPNVSFADSRVKWSDMSGDGLQDIVLIHDGSIQYWPNLGYGDWGKRITMRNSPRFPYGYDPKRILVGDVDGDGLADVVYVEDRKVTLWLNRSGNAWSDPVVIHGTPPVADLDAVRLADVMGAGVSGILWSRDADGLSLKRMFFLDLTGGVKPYLLNVMDNHMGAVTKVQYAPSTKFYLDDQLSPKARWQTPLPFPVLVVSRVEVIDDISKGKLTTEYRYHHGYWDGAEREFRGFGRVDQYDTESFADYGSTGLHSPDVVFADVSRRYFSPPTLTRTWFHQGPVGDEFGGWEEADYSREFWADDPQRLARPPATETLLRGLSRRARRDALRALRGTVLRTELYALDGSEHEERPYTVTEQVYGVREESKPEFDQEARLHIFFPHVRAQRTSQWERGDDPMTQITFTDGYDEFGQATQSTAAALPRRSARCHDVVGAEVGRVTPDERWILATHTRTEYALPESGVYTHDRVAQVRTFELAEPPEVSESAPDNLFRFLQDQTAAAHAVRVNFEESLKDWPLGMALPGAVRLIGHSVNHYDGAAFEGLAAGRLGRFGALTRSESLVLTDEVLRDAYGKQGERRPSYLGGNAALPNGAPSGFGQDLGYRKKADSREGHHDGYYADTKRQQFDFQADAGQQRGVVLAIQDALRHQVDVQLDGYWLLPEAVTDPAGLTTTAKYDYRLLQPEKVTDPNGHSSRFVHSPLGLLRRQYLEGREGEGGTFDKPEIEYTYAFFEFEHFGEPVHVHTRQRVCHANSAEPCEDLIETREYSDGFGRLIQKRTQAEELVFGETGDEVGLPPEQAEPLPAEGQQVSDRVVVSGWQVYDNKGRVIEKFEPFFDRGWPFQREEDAKRGQHASLFYDPRGQVVRTLNPDGSEQRVIFGIPGALDHPRDYAPTPWESYAYDANDLAPLSYGPGDGPRNGSPQPLSERAPALHHFTPSSSLLNALGKVICHVERNGPAPAADWFVTRSSYDIRGNLIAIQDALGRVAFEHAYDLLNRTLRIDSIDAGLRTSVFDAAGNLAEYRDSKGSVVLREYDALNRLTHLRARDDAEQDLTLRERLIYGDDSANSELSRDEAEGRNLLGRLYQHFDEAGLLQFDRCDFKGNVTRKARRVIEDRAIAAGWVVDWDAAASELALEGVSRAYQTDIRYDALNRPTEITYPADVAGRRAKLTPRYNRAGALESVQLDGQAYVTRLAYNAKGQRVLIAYGNGVMTRYAYDPVTFRLFRLRTERFLPRQPGSDVWIGTGRPLQDFAYEHDLAGNITRIVERVPECGIRNNPEAPLHPELQSDLIAGDVLIRRFEYDPIYRLISATGRQCDNLPANRPWDDAPRCTDYTRTRPYRQQYRYDLAGNMLRLSHSDAATREFQTVGTSNRLRSLTIGALTYGYQYDPNGNLIRENTERHFEWDHADRLIGFRNQPAPANTPPSVEARYLYGADGMRVKKWVRKNGRGGDESTVYIDGIFEHHRWGALPNEQNNRLHVMDNQSRIALVRAGPKHPNDGGPAVQYHLGDHLSSSHVTVGGSAADADEFINREEYFPYGETSFGSFYKKRYRFTGKERDEESGLCYHGARYCSPWLVRWMSCDPIGAVDALNLFASFKGNPIKFTDPSGTQSDSGTPSLEAQVGNGKLIGVELDEVAGVTDIRLHSCDCSAIESHSAPNGTPLLTSERLEQWAGVLYGSMQAITPGGFLAPSPAPDSRTFELGRAAGLQATGLTLAVAGTGGTTGGLLLSGTGAGAVVGLPIAGVSMAYGAQGVASAAVGQAVANRALAMSSSNGTGGSSSRDDDNRPLPQRGNKKATEHPVIKPGTKEWEQAVKDLRSANNGMPRNYRVSTVDDARRLLQEGRGYLPGYGKYGKYAPSQYTKGYEFHLNENYPGSRAMKNDLPHIKWVDWSGNAYGHIYFNINRFIGY